MKYKVNEEVKSLLKKDYERACNGFLVELLNMWELDSFYGYWIGDEIGGVYAYGDRIFINIDDIRYCVENDIEENEYIEWQDYCVFANEFHQTIPNFPSWHKGCPRLSEGEKQKLRDLKKELENTINEYKKCTDTKNNELF